MTAQINPSHNAGWWVIATAIFYQAFVIGIFLYCFTFWIAGWSEEFSASTSEVVLALSCGNIGAAIAALFIARLLTKVAVVKVIGAGIVLFAVGLWLVAIATALWQVLFIYTFVFGFAVCAIGPLSGQLLAVKWFDKRRSIAIGWVSIGSSLGGFICPPLVTMLIADLGWRQTHSILAMICLVLVLPLSLIMIKEPLKPASGEAERILESADVSTYVNILSEWKFWLILLTLAPFICSIYVYVANLAPFGADLGIETRQTALVMSLMALSMVVGKVVSGFLFDYMGTRNLLVLLSALLGASLLALISQPSYPVLMGASVMYGFSAGSYLTMTGALVNELYKASDFPGVFALLLVSNIWVYSVVPLSAVAREVSGSYEVIWLALLVLTSIGVIAALKVSKLSRSVAI